MDDNLFDEMLLGLIARQNPAALEALYQRHAQTAYNLITRIVRNTAIADELLQETFWQVWQKAGEFSGRGVVAAWIYRIARNKSLDELRYRKVRPQPIISGTAEAETALWAELPDETLSVEQMAENHLIQEQVQRALGLIPAEQRRCLELAYFEGLPQQQIAEFTQVPIGTVKTRLRLGLEKLERIFHTLS